MFLLSLSMCYFFSSAQPTSFGGVTPGVTTRAELRNIVKKYPLSDSFKLGDKDFEKVELLWLENTFLEVLFQNDVIYEVSTDFDRHELGKALEAKYGKPTIDFGSIRKVNCQNNFGAIFERYEGERSQL